MRKVMEIQRGTRCWNLRPLHVGYRALRRLESPDEVERFKETMRPLIVKFVQDGVRALLLSNVQGGVGCLIGKCEHTELEGCIGEIAAIICESEYGREDVESTTGIPGGSATSQDGIQSGEVPSEPNGCDMEHREG